MPFYLGKAYWSRSAGSLDSIHERDAVWRYALVVFGLSLDFTAE
jgi:hypothetical protein